MLRAFKVAASPTNAVLYARTLQGAHFMCAIKADAAARTVELKLRCREEGVSQAVLKELAEVIAELTAAAAPKKEDD